MKPQSVLIEGCSKQNRYEVINKLEKAIIDGGNWITDFHIYSDIEITLQLETTSDKVSNLYNSLIQAGLGLEENALKKLIEAAAQLQPGQDLLVYLDVNFIHSGPVPSGYQQA